MATQESNMPFIRNLASSGSYASNASPSVTQRFTSTSIASRFLAKADNSQHLDRKIRTSALASLQSFLRTRKPPSAQLTDLDARKLWKGLYYALWMCDRPIPQQNLCAELAELLFALHTSAAIPWLRGFWATMAAQWTDIDVLRMEKFLLLVRRVFAASLRWAKDMRWEDQAVAEMVSLFGEWPFDLEDVRRVPVGLRLHALDIWVDELEKAGYLAEDAEEQAKNFVQKIRELVEPLIRDSPTKTVRARATESFDDERLPWNLAKLKEGGDEAMEDEDDWEGIED
jgi:ribosomal RNA-processing protein 1